MATRHTEGSELDAILDKVRQVRNFDFRNDKRATQQRRIERRMTATGCRTRGAYLALLERDPEGVSTLVSSMLIKLTTFFRDAEVWGALDTLLRELVRRRRPEQELKQANEELPTSNHQPQTINEELETTNEELQSTNAELDTINRELAHRTSELGALSSIQRTIIRTLSEGVLVLDAEGRIATWNLAAERLRGLTKHEVLGQALWTLHLPTLKRPQVLGAVILFEDTTRASALAQENRALEEKLKK